MSKIKALWKFYTLVLHSERLHFRQCKIDHYVCIKSSTTGRATWARISLCTYSGSIHTGEPGMVPMERCAWCHQLAMIHPVHHINMGSLEPRGTWLLSYELQPKIPSDATAGIPQRERAVNLPNIREKHCITPLLESGEGGDSFFWPREVSSLAPKLMWSCCLSKMWHFSHVMHCHCCLRRVSIAYTNATLESSLLAYVQHMLMVKPWKQQYCQVQKGNGSHVI